MCNVRSNLIRGKHFDLEKGFLHLIYGRTINASNLLNTGGSKRKRDKTNLEIGLGLLLKFPSKEE
jgi:hypothetical protein